MLVRFWSKSKTNFSTPQRIKRFTIAIIKLQNCLDYLKMLTKFIYVLVRQITKIFIKVHGIKVYLTQEILSEDIPAIHCDEILHIDLLKHSF